MGDYVKSLSKRMTCERRKEGYCLICGEYKSLTEDHVPPQCAVTITRTEQKLVTEAFANDQPTVKGAPSKNGNKFKTICKGCNSALATGDQEIGRVCKELNNKIRYYFNSASSINTLVSVKINASKYIRAMVGHILAATSEDECKLEQRDSPYFTPMKNLVLGQTDSIDDTHDIYYWFYPRGHHLCAKMLGYHNYGDVSVISLLSFFPIAFLITEKGKKVHPPQATKLDSKNESLILNLSLRNHNHIDFPFCTLMDGQFYVLPEQTCTISYPVRKDA